MGIILYIILGIVAGWLASMVTNTNSTQGMVEDALVGMIGGLAAGFVMNLLGGTGVTGFNLYSLLVATVGAVAVISIKKAVATS